MRLPLDANLMRAARPALTLILLLGWASGVAWGWHQLSAYGSQPGFSAQAPMQLPALLPFGLEACRPALVMFVHPQCPCTRASLNEFARLQTYAQPGTQVVVAVRTDPAHPEWGPDSALWRHAQAAMAARVVADPQGAAAERFGALTSGHLLFYDGQARLRFSGGITPSRAHEGDSDALAHLRELVREESVQAVQAPVYGCPLFDDPTNHDPEARQVCAVGALR